MPTDDVNTPWLAASIEGPLHKITKDPASLSVSERADLIKNTERLKIALREPEEYIFKRLKRHRTLPLGPLSTWASSRRYFLWQRDQFTEALFNAGSGRAPPQSTHLFAETSPQHYIHNAFFTAFTTPANRDMFAQMYDFIGKGVYMMPDFLAIHGHQNPTSYTCGAFQYGHNTTLGFWEWLNEIPERAKLFNSGMRSLATVSGAAGAYPFDEELSVQAVDDTAVLIVDIGGGRGQLLEAVKAAFPDLKGRMILQDAAGVIADAKANDLPEFIKPMAVDFFERQPIEGALLYHFRRILHDWSDSTCLHILRTTARAMHSTRSRILITETIVPEMAAPRSMALQDINMMCLGGMERTLAQWERLCREAGLVVSRVWRREGGLQGGIEARLMMP